MSLPLLSPLYFGDSMVSPHPSVLPWSGPLAGPLGRVESADPPPARHPGAPDPRGPSAKGLWLWARAFLTAWLPPHRPLIHLTQQEARKLPFQRPSPARCGLCAFLYHPWQELCYTSWRERHPQRGHCAQGSFQPQRPLLPGCLPGFPPLTYCLAIRGH